MTLEDRIEVKLSFDVFLKFIGAYCSVTPNKIVMYPASNYNLKNFKPSEVPTEIKGYERRQPGLNLNPKYRRSGFRK